MKIVAGLILAVAFATTTVHAGDYETAVMQQQICDKAGQLGQIAFKSRKNKRDKADMIAVRDQNADTPAIYFAITYGLGAATSSQDAYMRSWAYCMDH